MVVWGPSPEQMGHSVTIAVLVMGIVMVGCTVLPCSSYVQGTVAVVVRWMTLVVGVNAEGQR